MENFNKDLKTQNFGRVRATIHRLEIVCDLFNLTRISVSETFVIPAFALQDVTYKTKLFIV